MDKVSRSQETKDGLAKAAGRGRFPGRKPVVTDAEIMVVIHLGTTVAAREVGLSRNQYIVRRRKLEAENGK